MIAALAVLATAGLVELAVRRPRSRLSSPALALLAAGLLFAMLNGCATDKRPRAAYDDGYAAAVDSLRDLMPLLDLAGAAKAAADPVTALCHTGGSPCVVWLAQSGIIPILEIDPAVADWETTRVFIKATTTQRYIPFFVANSSLEYVGWYEADGSCVIEETVTRYRDGDVIHEPPFLYGTPGSCTE